jgi:hypothetical protein
MLGSTESTLSVELNVRQGRPVEDLRRLTEAFEMILYAPWFVTGGITEKVDRSADAE